LKDKPFLHGMKDGLPICLGYISVSFVFGVMCTEFGLPVWAGVLMSMTNLTSAGQFAGLSLIVSGGGLFEIGMTTLIINLRYTLMSLSLSQKVDEKMPTLQRALVSFGNTDEIFAMCMTQDFAITTSYMSGMILVAYIGWALGTGLGATVTSLLPEMLRSALNMAIYGMFIAIILPPARKSRKVLLTVLLAVAVSCLFYYTPVLKMLSRGWVIIISTFLVAGFMAWKFPVKEEIKEEAMEKAGEGHD